MTRAGTERREVWLRGNLRPVLALGLVGAGAVGLAAAAALAIPLWSWVLAGAVCLLAAVLAILAWLAWAASRPRLVLEGDRLVVRLSPVAVERLPLDVVECVFRGTESLAGRAGAPPRFRVGTLVIRLAERASDWKARPSFRPWVTWEDGHVVIDGRWCEPLSPESARRIGWRLAEVKRQPAPACPP